MRLRDTSGFAQNDAVGSIELTETYQLLFICVGVLFVGLIAVLFFLLRRSSAYERQISQLIRQQRNFDLAWGHLKKNRYISKGNHPFFRKWGLQFPGASCTLDDLSAAFGWDLRQDYISDMKDMRRRNVKFVETEKMVISPLDGAPRYYRRYLHRINNFQFMTCLLDVTEEVSRAEELKNLATTDFLSHLMTRRAMDDSLVAKLNEIRKSGTKAFLLMLDIDDFKLINDTYGHDAGDEVLRVISGILQATEGCQCASRWGGEEFLVMLDLPHMEAACGTALSLIHAVDGVEIPVGDKHLSITISAGLAEMIPEEEYTYSVSRADRALYRAKAEGKNCLRIQN